MKKEKVYLKKSRWLLFMLLALFAWTGSPAFIGIS